MCEKFYQQPPKTPTPYFIYPTASTSRVAQPQCANVLYIYVYLYILAYALWKREFRLDIKYIPSCSSAPCVKSPFWNRFFCARSQLVSRGLYSTQVNHFKLRIRILYGFKVIFEYIIWKNYLPDFAKDFISILELFSWLFSLWIQHNCTGFRAVIKHWKNRHI